MNCVKRRFYVVQQVFSHCLNIGNVEKIGVIKSAGGGVIIDPWANVDVYTEYQ